MVVAALPELAAQDCAARLLPASTGGTSVQTHAVNARGGDRSDPSPFVRDMLDGHLLSSVRGIDSSDTLLVIIGQGVISSDTLFHRVAAMRARAYQRGCLVNTPPLLPGALLRGPTPGRMGR